MPVIADQITHKKLVLVKQLYQQALIQSASQHSIVGRIMSVIGFDLAVETVLKAVVGSLNSSKIPAGEFQALVQQTESLLVVAGLNLVPDKANIQHIHSIRNDAQHKAKYPNENDVSDCRTYARDFLQKIIREVWGTSFESISLTDLIQSAVAKGFLIQAEASLTQADYKEAALSSVAALTWSIDKVGKAIVGETISDSRRGFHPEEVGFRKRERNPLRALRRMQQTLLIAALGINFSEYMECMRLVGELRIIVHAYDDGTYRHYAPGVEGIKPDQAEFLFNYCCKTVVQIEERIGSLDTPLALFG